jgi:WD40 repeat protein/uncharacterized caspase-like protein
MSHRLFTRAALLLSLIGSGMLPAHPSSADVVDSFKQGSLVNKRWRLGPLMPELQPSREPPIILDELSRQAVASRGEMTADKPELVVQVGHVSHWIGGSLGQALSPDGRYLVSGGLVDGTVKIWDVVSGECLRSMVAHAEKINAVAFSPDGNLIITGSDDMTAKIWRLASGELVRTIRVEPFASIEYTARLMGEVVDVEVSPDGDLLALGIDGWVPRIFDMATGQELHTLVGHENSNTSIAFHPGGQMVATGSMDGTARIWDVQTGREIQTLKSGGDGVSNVCFSRDGRWLGAVVHRLKGKYRVRAWTTDNWKKSRDFASMELLFHLAFSPDSRHLVTIGMGKNKDEHYLQLFDAAKGKRIWSQKEPQASSCPVFSPDGRWLFTSGDRLAQRDATTGEQVRTFGYQIDNLRTAILAPEAGILATTSGGNASIDIWDLALGGVRHKISRDEEVTAVANSPDGRSVAIGNSDGKVYVKNLFTGAVDLAIDAHDALVQTLTFSPNGQWLASGTSQGSIKLWERSTGRHVVTLRSHTGETFIRGLSFSADSRLLASCGWDKSARVWSVPAGDLQQTLMHDEFVHNTVLSPDGRWLASVQSFITTGRQIKLWDVESGELVYILLDRDIDWAAGLAFTPDGRHLATGLAGGLIALWKIGTAADLTLLTGHSGSVNSISSTPDGTLMLSGSSDGTLMIWDAATYRPLATLISIRGSLDWIVVTPDGLFDGSPAAWKQLAWRFGGSTFDVAPIELFFNEYYYPRLLTDIIEGRRPLAPSDLAAKDRRQPDITITVAGLAQGESTTNRMATVHIEVADAPADETHPRGCGARDLRLFRNGVLVKTWPDDLLGDEQSVRLEASIPLVSGENVLSAYAFNDDNIKSADASLIVKGHESLQRNGTLYIVAVGIDRYSNPDYNLRFAVTDARTFAQSLAQSQQKLHTYENVEVLELADDKATKAEILAVLARLAGTEAGEAANQPPSDPAAASRSSRFDKAQPEDGVVVYFAGHGTAQQDRFYLLPHDLGYQGDMVEIDEDGLAVLLRHGISDRELESAFSGIDACRMLLVIDACNSGQALEAEEKRRGPMNSKGLAQLAYEKGMYILTAAQAYQVAMETSELGHGFLTYALVEEGLKTDAADYQPDDGEVQLREWLDFAVARVPEIHAEMTGLRAHPARGLKVITSAERRERVEDWKVQRPRVFYRRTPETEPMIIVRP